MLFSGDLSAELYDFYKIRISEYFWKITTKFFE